MASDPENARLSTLRSYSVLDTSAEPAFDGLVRLAAEIFGAPTAAMTLVDADRCWFKAKVGLDAPQLPRDVSFCGHAFASSGIFVVPDAMKDNRFKDLPIVAGGAGFRFYAGAPLRAPDGHSLGTLCVLDRIPCDPTPQQLSILSELAARVMSLLEDRREVAAPDIPVAPVSIAPAGSDNLVLVVDDEDSVRAFTAEVLKHLGHAVFSAANGADALVRIAELRGRVRLVVTDLSMPVMGGLELVRALRKQPNPPAIVAMSGHFNQEYRAQLRAAGVTCMLGKPFSVDELKLAILNAQSVAR
jgi:CheY-like chemotaxis protein